jgi:hypothetical protein
VEGQPVSQVMKAVKQGPRGRNRPAAINCTRELPSPMSFPSLHETTCALPSVFGVSVHDSFVSSASRCHLYAFLSIDRNVSVVTTGRQGIPREGASFPGGGQTRKHVYKQSYIQSSPEKNARLISFILGINNRRTQRTSVASCSLCCS